MFHWNELISRFLLLYFCFNSKNNYILYHFNGEMSNRKRIMSEKKRKITADDEFIQLHWPLECVLRCSVAIDSIQFHSLHHYSFVIRSNTVDGRTTKMWFIFFSDWTMWWCVNNEKKNMRRISNQREEADEEEEKKLYDLFTVFPFSFQRTAFFVRVQCWPRGHDSIRFFFFFLFFASTAKMTVSHCSGKAERFVLFVLTAFTVRRLNFSFVTACRDSFFSWHFLRHRSCSVVQGELFFFNFRPCAEHRCRSPM